MVLRRGIERLGPSGSGDALAVSGGDRWRVNVTNVHLELLPMEDSPSGMAVRHADVSASRGVVSGPLGLGAPVFLLVVSGSRTESTTRFVPMAQLRGHIGGSEVEGADVGCADVGGVITEGAVGAHRRLLEPWC